MQLLKLIFACFAFLFFFVACNSNTTAEQIKIQDTANIASSGKTPSFVYDSTLDPAKVGPNVKVWHDTLGMKLFEITLKPGDTFPMHAHPDHAMYILEGGTVAFTPKGGERIVAEFTTGGFINGPYTDAGKNIGKTTVRILEVDVYRPRN